MALDEADGHNRRSDYAGFATTHWSLVLAAATQPSASTDALETLCRSYWPPVYTYIRRRGHPPHEAQDLTQAFFAALLARNAWEKVRPEHGKFRSFLVASVNNFLANEYDRSHAAKRGGDHPILSLEEMAAEDGGLMKVVSNDGAETALDRRWALTVLNRALCDLKAEFVAANRELVFERLKRFLEEEARAGDYSAMASELGMTAGAVAVAVHRLRQRYRGLVRHQISQTVSRPEDLEDEMRHLLAAVSGAE